MTNKTEYSEVDPIEVATIIGKCDDLFIGKDYGAIAHALAALSANLIESSAEPDNMQIWFDKQVAIMREGLRDHNGYILRDADHETQH
jgi:hypothetical protein